jgi:hypothetical protein
MGIIISAYYCPRTEGGGRIIFSSGKRSPWFGSREAGLFVLSFCLEHNMLTSVEAKAVSEQIGKADLDEEISTAELMNIITDVLESSNEGETIVFIKNLNDHEAMVRNAHNN